METTEDQENLGCKNYHTTLLNSQISSRFLPQYSTLNNELVISISEGVRKRT